ncbi:4Fe-4S binding protein [Geoglobus sp.]
MRTILCESCTGLDVKSIAENISDEVEVVEGCASADADVVGCTALSQNSRVVDLRLVERVFENPETVASSWINAELITADPEYDVIETGYSVVYVGSNLDVVNILSNFAELTVVTESEELIRELYPFRNPVFKGRVKSVSGKIGNLKVVIEGEDLVKEEKGVFEITCGQAILPEGLTRYRSGVITYGDEYKAAVKIIERLGSVKVLKSVKVNPDVCAVEKSGISGCRLCFSCPTSSVLKVGGRVEFDYLSCAACGYCSSVCPTEAIRSTVLPADTLLEKIDAAGEGVIAFICEKSLGELYELGRKGVKVPEIHPVMVPCLNYVSEVHYLYAVLRGSYVVAVPCECEYSRYADYVRVASEILSAFGFSPIRVASFKELGEVVRGLKKEKHPGKMIERASSAGRKLMASMLEQLLKYPVADGKELIETDRFAEVTVSEGCTFCKTCQAFCPTGAIRRDEETARLYFNHIMCIACSLCEKACPENAVSVKNGLNLRDVSARVLFEAEMVECPSCGRKHISKIAHEKISEIVGLKVSTMYCEDCRPKMILETIYREMEGE